MRGQPIQIHWHDKQPVFSIDFDPKLPTRLASSGGDHNIRLWRVTDLGPASLASANFDSPPTGPEKEAQFSKKVDYVATLTRHTNTVNCVRFSPSGEFLASAGDDGVIIVWKESDTPIAHSKLFGQDDDDDADRGKDGEDGEDCEFWNPQCQFRASDTEDIYDLAWSPDSKYIIVGLTDNTAQVWDTQIGKLVRVLKDHSHFVQGVAWDPLGQHVVTQSSDRSVKLWNVAYRMNSSSQNVSLSFSPLNKISRIPISCISDPLPDSPPDQHSPHVHSPLSTADSSLVSKSDSSGQKMVSLFHDETLVSFFRRGSLLVSVEGFDRGVVAIRCNPRLFKHFDSFDISSGTTKFNLPYRIIYAVISQDKLTIFDSTQTKPIFVCTGFHYGSLTDVAWSADGSMLIISATDGFCSIFSFSPKDLGEPLDNQTQESLLSELKTLYPPKMVATKLATPSLSTNLNIATPLQSMINNNNSGNGNSGLLEESVPPSLPTSEIDMNFEDRKCNNGMEVEMDQSKSLVQQSPSNSLPVKRRIQPTLLSCKSSLGNE